MYDPEQYREKREKVLGIRKRGIGFGTASTIAALVILIGLCSVSLPQAFSYLKTRHLDDAIYKLESSPEWPAAVISGIQEIQGVRKTRQDTDNHTRLVVTFDRRQMDVDQINRVMAGGDLKYTLLNRVNHRQHLATMESEEEGVETP